MKKLSFVLAILLSFTAFAVVALRSPRTVLYLLNWGEYINYDLISLFEMVYDCQVKEETVTSSEAMYQKITAKTTPYDVAIPGDYAVNQLYRENQLLELDVNNQDYEYLGQYETMFTNSLSSLIEKYMVNDQGECYNTYFMPYFWGAYSIMYSEQYADVPEVIKKNGFASLYNRSLYAENVKIGMYDTARWIVASYLMSRGKDPNITSYDGTIANDLDAAIENDVKQALFDIKFDSIQNDSLKRDVANKKLDLCFVQLGDFFDTLYLVYDDGKKTEIDFNVFVPKTTSAFFDSMIIPKTCKNYDLANKFINFMLNPLNAYENAQGVGYCPTLKAVCDAYHRDAEDGAYYYGDKDSKLSLTLEDFLVKYPNYLDPLYGCENYYLFETKSNEYLTTCETILNSLAKNNNAK